MPHENRLDVSDCGGELPYGSQSTMLLEFDRRVKKRFIKSQLSLRQIEEKFNAFKLQCSQDVAKMRRDLKKLKKDLGIEEPDLIDLSCTESVPESRDRNPLTSTSSSSTVSSGTAIPTGNAAQEPDLIDFSPPE